MLGIPLYFLIPLGFIALYLLVCAVFFFWSWWSDEIDPGYYPCFCSHKERLAFSLLWGFYVSEVLIGRYHAKRKE